MILRVTFNDNDYIQELESYFRKFLVNFTNLLDEYRDREDEQSIKHYVDTSVKIDDCLKYITYSNKEDKELENTFLVLLRNSINIFVDNNTYLKTNLDISIVKSVSDKDENGEVIYYFTKHHTFLTM